MAAVYSQFALVAVSGQRGFAGACFFDAAIFKPSRTYRFYFECVFSFACIQALVDSFIENSLFLHAATQSVFTPTLKCMGLVLVYCKLDNQTLGDFLDVAKFNRFAKPPNVSRRIDR